VGIGMNFLIDIKELEVGKMIGEGVFLIFRHMVKFFRGFG
jgi:hypothetical protein